MPKYLMELLTTTLTLSGAHQKMQADEISSSPNCEAVTTPHADI